MGTFKANLSALSAGAADTVSYLWNKPIYTLLSGASLIAAGIGINMLLGKKATIAYLSTLCVLFVGIIGRKSLKSSQQTFNNPPVLPTPPRINNPCHAESRSFRIKIAEQNIDHSEKGFYITPRGAKFYLPTGAELSSGSLCFYSKGILAIIEKQEELSSRRYEATIISVVNKGCLETAQEHATQGDGVAILNFACQDAPGGNFEAGFGTHEEEICFRSSLSGFMHDQLLNVGESNSLYPLDNHYSKGEHLIHTPNVIVYRAGPEENYDYLEDPYEIGILTAASLELPALINADSLEVDYANEEDRQKVRILIITQLYAASLQFCGELAYHGKGG